METYVGVVLAGGKSSRMGRDKATLVWQGKTLVEHQADVLTQSGASRVVVSGAWLGRESLGRESLRRESLADLCPGGGPLRALAGVAAQLPPGARVVVVPVDMPGLTARHLKQLAEQASPLVAFAQNPLPLALSLTPDVLKALTALSKLPTAGLHRLWPEVEGSAWLEPPADGRVLVNLNTPADWRRATSGAAG